MDEVKNSQCCIENRQLASTSSSSGSERTYSAPLKSPGICSPVKTSPSRRRTTGPIRRAKGGWTPEEDEKLKNAVKAFKGKSWKKIAESFPDRSEVQCLHRWRKVLNPDLVKGPWSQEEDSAIIELVSKYGPAKWSLIAKSLPGRIGKQCRERWHNHLNPMIKKDAWTLEEELAVMDAHQKHGNKWAEIAKVLPGRTDNSIKNHWYTYLRKKLNYYMATGKLPPPDMVESSAKDLKPFRSTAPDRITVHDSERIEVTARSSSGNKDFHQMDEACKNQVKSSNLQFRGSDSSARTVVNGSNNSDNREHNQVTEKLGIICSKSSSISTSVNSGNDTVVENGNNVPGTPVGVGALGSLLVEKQQLENLNVPSDSVTINTHSCTDKIYDSNSVMSPACLFSPPSRQSSGMGSLSAESILKSAARSFPNIPSILRKRRREARSPQGLERTEEADNVKAKDSSHTPEEKVTVGDKQEQPGSLEANSHCESPCDSNSTVGVWLYNGQAFDASPPYRLSSKRADIIKSVEKQLEFEFDGDNFDSQPRSTNLVITGTVTEDRSPPLKFFYRRKNRKISKAGGGLT